MHNTQRDPSHHRSLRRETRHDLLSLAGGALLGVGLVLGPAVATFAWALILVGAVAALSGAVWSGRVAFASAQQPLQCQPTRDTTEAPADAHDDED